MGTPSLISMLVLFLAAIAPANAAENSQICSGDVCVNVWLENLATIIFNYSYDLGPFDIKTPHHLAVTGGCGRIIDYYVLGI